MLTVPTSKIAMLTGFGMLIAPAIASAQEAAPAKGTAAQGAQGASAGQDIVVTAERRKSTVFNTPIAITAVSGEAMDRLQITTPTKLAEYIPGLDIATHGQVSGSAVVSIRGIGSASVIGEPTVAVHVDGQYFAVGRSLNSTFYDLSRVEVLKGPQGTLYGRNSTAGVINVITAPPENEFKGSVTAMYGNYNAISSQGMINVPLIDSVLAVRLAYNINKHDGYQKGAIQDIFDENDHSLRGSILFRPTPNLTLHFITDYYRDNSNGPGYIVLNNPYLAGPADPFVNYFNTPTYRRQTSSSYRLAVDWDLGGVTLSSLTGFVKDLLDSRVDQDGNNVQVAYSDRKFDFRSFQQELRLSGKIGTVAEWQLGGFYYNEDKVERFFAHPDLIPTAGQPPVRPFTLITPAGQLDPIFNLTLDPNTVREKSYAVFTNDKFHLSDQLTLTVGARLNRDKYSQVRVQPTVTDHNGSQFSSFTWRVGLDWKPSAGQLLYANISTGFKSGGANEVTGTPAYRPEKITAYEVGWKAHLLDNRLSFSTAAFYYDYRDLQVTVIQNNASLTSNASGGKVYGAEFDGRASLARRLNLTASATYVHSRIGNISIACPMTIAPVCPGIPNFFPSGGATLNISGSPFAQSPRLSAALGLEYRAPFASGDVVARANYSYRSRMNTTIFAGKAPFDVLQAAPSNNVDASLRYEAKGDRWFGEVFVNNLTNELRKVSGQVIPPSGIYASYAPPRTFGVRFGVKFN